LTPSQLRIKARSFLESAKRELKVSPDVAAYLTGYSVEMMLKARICTMRQWSRLPSSSQELKNWNEKAGIDRNEKIFIHDLERLMKLNESTLLNSTKFRSIDWEKACTWSEQLRYVPEGDISEEYANELVCEVDKVVDTLNEYEIVNSVQEMEAKIESRFGPFDFFGLLNAGVAQKWILMTSARAPTDAVETERRNLLKESFDGLDIDIKESIITTLDLSVEDPAIQSALMQVQLLVGGGIKSSPSAMFGGNTITGFITIPPGYFITAGFWDLDILKKEWADAGLVL